MDIQTRWLEHLMIRCLNDSDYGAALERLCRQYPRSARNLRARIATLERHGFLRPRRDEPKDTEHGTGAAAAAGEQGPEAPQ